MPQPIALSLHGVYVQLDDGEVKLLIDDASDKLAELVQSVTANGKAGSLTLKIDLKPSTAGALAVRGEVKIKKPATLPREALLWPTPEGNLIAEDPKQSKLPLREVAAEKPELRAANG